MRAPLPPFDDITAAQKVRAAEDAWNTRDPERVAGAYTPDCVWRNRSEFIHWLSRHNVNVSYSSRRDSPLAVNNRIYRLPDECSRKLC